MQSFPMNPPPGPVQLFIPCYVDLLYPQVGQATVRVLEAVGCQVIFPREQTCCGQPAWNTGYRQEAASVAGHWLQAFDPELPVVSPSGSCTAMVRRFFAQLPLPASLHNRWRTLQSRVFELSAFLVDALGIQRWPGRLSLSLCYHDGCHALRELGIARQPRQLLASIAGVRLQEMSHADTCCGFGGTFSVKFPQLSTAMVARKAVWIQQSGARAVVSTEPSCLLQIAGYLNRQQIPVQALHLAQVLARALDAIPQSRSIPGDTPS